MSSSVEISRYFLKHEGWTAEVRIRINSKYVYFSSASSKMYKTETAAVKMLISRLESLFPIIPNLKERIEEKYKVLMGRYGGRKVDFEDVEEVCTFSQAQADQMTHLSCRFHSEKNYKLRVTRANTQELGLPQFDLKHRIQNLEKNSRAFKFFNKNTCSVCLETFKEVLDDDRHLVITSFSCNHVLCCACLDSILKRKEPALCPMCKSELDPFAFDLVLLHVDFTVNEEYTGKIFVDHTGNSDSEWDS